MSADLLREAAALMRERAEAATDGPWVAEYEDGDVWGPQNRERICCTSSYSYGPDAEHIASWHPAVALAVADWLEREADLCDNFDARFGDRAAWPRFRDYRHGGAFAVARAYFGRDA